jgi:recombinational DNA repair protein RecR
MQLPEPLERLIAELSRLPGVGPKTAQRLAFHLLRADKERVERLAEAIPLRDMDSTRLGADLLITGYVDVHRDS